MGGEDDEDAEDDVLTLTDQDRDTIDAVKSIVRRLLKHPRTTPRLIAAVGFALQAMDEFPDVKSAVSVELSICYRNNGEMSDITFRVSEYAFQISVCSTVNMGCGTDTISEPGYRLEVSGHASRNCDLVEIEDQVAELLNLGAEITASVEGGNFDEMGWQSDEEIP